MAVGVLIGFGIGLLSRDSKTQQPGDWDLFPDSELVFYPLALGLLGAAIGAAATTDQWEPIPLEALRELPLGGSPPE
jgi:hypothetical protein